MFGRLRDLYVSVLRGPVFKCEYVGRTSLNRLPFGQLCNWSGLLGYLVQRVGVQGHGRWAGLVKSSVGLELEFRVAGLVMSVCRVRVGVQGHWCWVGLVMSVSGAVSSHNCYSCI